MPSKMHHIFVRQEHAGTSVFHTYLTSGAKRHVVKSEVNELNRDERRQWYRAYVKHTSVIIHYISVPGPNQR